MGTDKLECLVTAARGFSYTGNAPQASGCWEAEHTNSELSLWGQQEVLGAPGIRYFLSKIACC